MWISIMWLGNSGPVAKKQRLPPFTIQGWLNKRWGLIHRDGISPRIVGIGVYPLVI